MSAPNGLGGIPSDDDDMEEDDDVVDGDGDPGSSQHGNSTRDGKRLASQLNGDKSGKPRKKKTRTVFSRSQVNINDIVLLLIVFKLENLTTFSKIV